MENLLVNLHNYFFVGTLFLMICQAIVLLIRGKNNVPRQSMAYMELVWGAGYLFTLVLINTIIPSSEYTLMREKYVLIGGVYMSFMAIFLMQVLIPGWLNWKRFLWVESPFVGMAVIYYGVTYLLGESIVSIVSYKVLWESLGQFNVWFRFVVLAFELIYIMLLLRWLHGYKKKYIQWENENFADQENVDISWIKTYIFIIVGITFFYLVVFFGGGRFPVLCHTLFVAVAFTYLFYKMLFYESPYPTDFFASMEEDKQKEKSDEIYVIAKHDEVEEEMNEVSFESDMSTYVNTLTKWMEEEKPYLYTDFKLTDVSRVLHMNRTYLSRAFNEGFGHNFSEVVRRYRVDYSIEVLQNNADLSLQHVAEMSGFHSEVAYARAFKIVKGMTPIQYKMQMEAEDK